MKRSVLALAVLIAMSWSTIASAQTTMTPCPANYQCSFSAAETLPLGASVPAAPASYIGYLSFDATGANVSVTGTQNVNGTVTSTGLTATCTAAGSSGQPATLTLSDGSQIQFVANGFKGGAVPGELDFMTTSGPAGAASPNANIRVGVCRQL